MATRGALGVCRRVLSTTGALEMGQTARARHRSTAVAARAPWGSTAGHQANGAATTRAWGSAAAASSGRSSVAGFGFGLRAGAGGQLCSRGFAAEAGDGSAGRPVREEAGAASPAGFPIGARGGVVPSPLARAPAPRSSLRPGVKGALKEAADKTRVRAVLREAKGSPKKFNDVLRLIRGLSLRDALHQCSLSPKKYARRVKRVIESAAANATNNHDLDRDRLVIDEAIVGKGTFLKRVSIHGRGRAGTMTKPRSHVRIVVTESDEKTKKSMWVREFDPSWKKHRRKAIIKHTLAKEAGLA